VKAAQVAGKQTQTGASVDPQAAVPGKSTQVPDPAAVARGPRGPKGEKGDKGDKGDPGIDIATLGEFTERYDKAVHGWHSIAQKMVLAIDSIYTEAKKPKRPDIGEEIMVTLAVAALGGLVGLAGSLIASRVGAFVAESVPLRAAPTKIPMYLHTLGDGTEALIDGAAARAVRESTETWAKVLADAAKDAFKDAVKLNARPAIEKLLRAGKHPMDAFFEGQKEVVIDSARRAQIALLELRTETLMTAADPVLAAEAHANAIEARYDEIMEVTRTETLQKWLLLQAQSRLGTQKAFHRATKMDALPSVSGGMVQASVTGIIYVDVLENEGSFHAARGHLPGMTSAMLAQIQDQPIGALGLPIVYRVVNPGAAGLPGSGADDRAQFNIRVDERGGLTLGGLSSFHRDFLGGLSGFKPTTPKGFWSSAAWSDAALTDGAQTINTHLRQMTLAQLKVEPDHG
jgi:hypothetical protein